MVKSVSEMFWCLIPTTCLSRFVTKVMLGIKG